MLKMDIRSVKPTDEDYALGVPLNILKGLNADSINITMSGSERVVTCVKYQCERLTSGVDLLQVC